MVLAVSGPRAQLRRGPRSSSTSPCWSVSPARGGPARENVARLESERKRPFGLLPRSTSGVRSPRNTPSQPLHGAAGRVSEVSPLNGL